MNDEDTSINRGSEWRKWDLHIHTPFSHTSEYPGSTEEEKWTNFFDALEHLPNEIKVIGVNDYLFLDGYRKVLKYKKEGNLKNIDLILPVIEFRLREFVGQESLRKINYHIIFADESLLTLETIEAQFLSCFRSSCNLDRNYANTATWGGVVTPKSIEDLGKEIYDNTPEEKRNSDSLFKIGFDSLSYTLDKLKECLGEIKEPNTYLKNKYLKVISKSEWEDFRIDGSPADKIDIINSANFVFSASPDANQAIRNIESLKENGVNRRLLHCSDAHKVKHGEKEDTYDFMNTSPNELGHCFTWIKGSTIFETLRQASVDYDNRVLIQDRNPADNKNSSPNLYIDKIEYKLNDDIHTLYLNKDINTVIGMRGAGKSVLLKHIAQEILGNEEYKTKYARNISKLKNFKLYWCDNKNEDKFVEYIPQNYLSTITYEDGEKYDERDKELKDRLFNNDLFKKAETSKKETVNSIEVKVVANIKNILDLDEQILDTQKQLKSLGRVEDKNTAIEIKQGEISKLGKIEITDEDINKQTKLSVDLESLNKEIKLIEQDIQIIKPLQSQEDTNYITIDESLFVGVSKNTWSLIKNHIDGLSSREIKGFLDTVINDLNKRLKEKKEKKISIEKVLLPINEKLQKNKTIESILKEINKLNNEKKNISELEKLLKEMSEKRDLLIDEVVNLYFSFERSITSIVETLKDTFNDFTFINFDFTVSYNEALYKSQFFDIFVDARSGKEFEKTVEEKRDFTPVELKLLINKILSGEVNMKASGGDKESALVALLKCRYDIDFTKSVKYKDRESATLVDFENMTGGQKAMALLDLIFNLSKSNYPIIIDQPENDIDVSGISNDLKELILKQKERRQVIIATHSPNLLLLVDSENVIVAKNHNNSITYQNGGIEDKEIQNKIIEILEGGEDALKKRMNKLNTRN